MSTSRLSPLDASFLGVESPTAHMHVGWAAVLDPPEDRPAPTFEQLRDHIEARLGRAPRYRQMLRKVPFGLNAPVWVDDPDFDLSRHVIRAESSRLVDVVDAAMSEPLPRDRPLWQMCIAPRLEDGRVALVGKAHHCMVDGIAAVELGSLLLDPTPEPAPVEPGDWRPRPAPGGLELLVRGALDLVRDELRLAAIPARALASPSRAGEIVDRGRRALGALADSARPARFIDTLNRPISPRRHLSILSRPIEDLLRIKRSHGVKLNDVVLAVATDGMRRFMADHGERPVAVKAMVPVSVRSDRDGDGNGNRISFMFIDLPCDEPDPLRRMHEIHGDTDDRKSRRVAEGGDDVVGLLGLVPGPLQRLVSWVVASPRTFNLVVSNIPGPRGESYMRGCRLRQAYPVVPLADRHTLSIGFTTVADSACFGLYADRDSLPDVDHLADCIDAAIDGLEETGRVQAPRAAVLG
ncbi:MAG: wax ester/triacylglycerol synthase family O-acyltransferase [Solirubrobacterales bacterium]